MHEVVLLMHIPLKRNYHINCQTQNYENKCTEKETTIVADCLDDCLDTTRIYLSHKRARST